MFKNLIVFRIKPTWSADLSSVEDSLNRGRFAPCGPTQVQASGWVEPRGIDHGPLVENVGGQWMVKLCIEKKVLPGDVVKRKVEEHMKNIEQRTGARPGKKQAKDIKEEVVLELLPKAFTKMEMIPVWLDPVNKFAIVDAGSVAKADGVISALVESIEGIGFDLTRTTLSATVVMSEWLLAGEATAPWAIDRECELKSTGEDKAVVKYANHNLEIDEIKKHIVDGKVPAKLALTWKSRVSLVLTDASLVKRLRFLDVVFENSRSTQEDAFDADFAILTGEVRKLIPDLLESLGGELREG